MLAIRRKRDGLYFFRMPRQGFRGLAGREVPQALRLWDLATGKTLLTLKGHTEAVNSVAFSPDGKRALSGGQDWTLRASITAILSSKAGEGSH